MMTEREANVIECFLGYRIQNAEGEYTYEQFEKELKEGQYDNEIRKRLQRGYIEPDKEEAFHIWMQSINTIDPQITMRVMESICKEAAERIFGEEYTPTPKIIEDFIFNISNGKMQQEKINSLMALWEKEKEEKQPAKAAAIIHALAETRDIIFNDAACEFALKVVKSGGLPQQTADKIEMRLMERLEREQQIKEAYPNRKTLLFIPLLEEAERQEKQHTQNCSLPQKEEMDNNISR